MKTQEAAWKASRKPVRKPKEVILQPRGETTPQKVSKNASRNERRKAARKVASLLRVQRVTAVKEEDAPAENEQVVVKE